MVVVVTIGIIITMVVVLIFSLLIGDTFRSLNEGESYKHEKSSTGTFKTLAIGIAIVIFFVIIYNKCTHGG